MLDTTLGAKILLRFLIFTVFISIPPDVEKKNPRYSARFTSGSNAKIATLLYKACPSIHVHIHVYAYVLNSKNLYLCVKALVSDFVQYFSGHLTKYSNYLNFVCK